MTIVLQKGGYYSTQWFYSWGHVDLLGVLYKEPDDSDWHFKFRIAIRVDDRDDAKNDKKLWRHVTSPSSVPEEDAISDCEVRMNSIADKMSNNGKSKLGPPDFTSRIDILSSDLKHVTDVMTSRKYQRCTKIKMSSDLNDDDQDLAIEI